MENGKDGNNVCEIMFDGFCPICETYTLFWVDIEIDSVVSELCSDCRSLLIITNIMGIGVGQRFFNMLATLQAEVH